MEGYKRNLPKTLLEYLDELDASAVRRGRPKSHWHAIAFQKVEQLSREGVSLRMACSHVEQEFLASRNLGPGTLRKLYNRSKQAALADDAAAAVVDGREQQFAAAWEQLRARERKDRSRK